MELTLSTKDLAMITRHCEAHYPQEGCGILIGRVEEERKVVLDVILTDNAYREERRHRRYTIPPAQLLQGELQAEKVGLQVIGYFHSHPDHPARPSVHDFELAWPDYSYLILAVQEGVTADRRSWQLEPDRSGFAEESITSLHHPSGRKNGRTPSSVQPSE